jgi:hypothetical protein
MIEYQWVLDLDGEPCDELVFQVNLSQRMVYRHFTSVRDDFGLHMPQSWIPIATKAVCDPNTSDAARNDVDLLEMMSEIMRKHALRWRKLGPFIPDIGYRVPHPQDDPTFLSIVDRCRAFAPVW